MVTAMIRLLDRLHDQPTIVEVDHVEVTPDQERAARIAEKIEEAKRFLGERYLCHPSRRVEKKAA
jgi:hypothetical protein